MSATSRPPSVRYSPYRIAYNADGNRALDHFGRSTDAAGREVFASEPYTDFRNAMLRGRINEIAGVLGIHARILPPAYSWHWRKFLVEFIWPDFDSRPAAAVPFPYIVLPSIGWHFAATVALEFVGPEIRQAIATAAASGAANAVFVSAAGETSQGQHEHWPPPEPELEHWPDDPPAATEGRQGEATIDAADEAAAAECRDQNHVRYCPTPAEISEATRIIRDNWTPQEKAKALGKEPRMRSRRAVFGSMTDRSLYPDD